MIRPGLVPAFGQEVEDGVSAEHRFASAAKGGVGVKDVARLILVEHAVSRHVFNRNLPPFVVVIDLPLGDLVRREGDVEIVVEVAAEGRHPFEAPAHALFHHRDLCQRRARDRDVAHVMILKMHEDAADVIDFE